MSPQNNLTLSFSFQGIVWKILCHPSLPLIAAEIRNGDERTVSFVVIDTNKKVIAWQGHNPSESWWTGLEAFEEDYLFFYLYRDIQFPDHKGITAVSLRKNQLLWESKELIFLAFSGGLMYCYKNEGEEKKFYIINKDNGNIEKEIIEEEVAQALNSQENYQPVNTASQYTSGNQYFPKIAEFILFATGKKAAKAVDYLEYKNKIIASFYMESNQQLDNYLFVINEEGKKELEELIGKGITAIGLDTFFVFRDILFFVKNKRELVLHLLNR